MEKEKAGLTRRDFVKGVSLAAVGGASMGGASMGGASMGGAVGLPGVEEEIQEPQSTSRVVLIRDEGVVSEGGGIDADGIQQMLDQALMSLLGLESPSDCWKSLIKPDDVVGIKTNIWRFLPTPPEVENAIRRGVKLAGVPEENIGMGDQDVLRKEIFQRTTALINSRPMRTHSWSGVGSLIKNYIMFDTPSDYHDDACADLAKLWELPSVKGKTRMNVLVMLTPQYHNVGPHHFDPIYTWPYKGLIVSTDPVAADAVGLRIIQAKRREAFGEDRPLQPRAHHIQLAETVHKLGVADMDRIDLVRLGWTGEELI